MYRTSLHIPQDPEHTPLRAFTYLRFLISSSYVGGNMNLPGGRGAREGGKGNNKRQRKDEQQNIRRTRGRGEVEKRRTRRKGK